MRSRQRRRLQCAWCRPSPCRGQQEALLVLSPPLLDQLRQTMATSDVVRYRGYEVSNHAVTSVVPYIGSSGLCYQLR